jgi:F-type H+-transporting ATPase subunit b
MKASRIWLRVFALVVLAASLQGFSLRAHAQSAAPEPSQSATQDSARTASEQAAGASKEQAGGEEKGEEKDEKEQFKHSSSVRLIGRILKLDSERSYWFAVIINFAVIAGIFVWAARKTLPGWARGRAASIQKAMQEAQKASEEARRRLADIESRLMKLDVEIGMMRNAAEREATAEEARMQVAAEEEGKKIVVAAEQEIAAAAKAARRQLTAYAADLAVALAQKQIRVDPATDQSLVREFAGQLTSAPDDPGKGRN